MHDLVSEFACAVTMRGYKEGEVLKVILQYRIAHPYCP